MLYFFGASENIVFVSALVLMLLVGVVEAIGLGAAGFELDIDIDHDGLLGWLGIGRLPLLVVLIAFLACFGLLGLIGQQLWLGISRTLVPALIAVPLAGVAALPLTGLLARALGRILPRDESSAISLDQLTGCVAELVTGRATVGGPAKARVRDHFGQSHYVMVEPDTDAESFAEGDRVLLIRREAASFRAILYTDHRYLDWKIS